MAEIKLKWVLDVTDRGAGQKILAQDRALRASLTKTDALYRKVGTTSVSAFSRQASASRQATVAAEQQTRAVNATAVASSRLATAQRNLLSMGRALATQTGVVTAALRRHAAASLSAATAELSFARARRSITTGAGAIVGALGKVGRAATSAIAALGLPVTFLGVAGFGLAIKQTIEFDRALRNVNSIAQLSEGTLQEVGKRIRQIGAETAQQPAIIARGMYDLVSSGFDAKDSLLIVASAARAATAGLSTTAVSTKTIAAVLNAYRMPAEKAAEISDVLFRTVDRGVLTFEELANTIGPVLPFAASLGVNLKEVGAAASTLTKQGIAADRTFTFLRATFTALLKPSTSMLDAFKKLGVTSGDELIRQRGLQGALEAVVGATDRSKSAVAKLFPNIRALTGVLGLTGQNAKAAQGDLKLFADTNGATARALGQQAKSISYQWDKLKATFTGFAIGVGNKLIPAINKLLELLSKLGKEGGALSGVMRGLEGRKPIELPKQPAAPRAAVGAGATRPGGRGPEAGAVGAGGVAPGARGYPGQAPLIPQPTIWEKVGAAIRTTVKAVIEFGKQLIDSLKPAMPFLQNVLFPLVKGIFGGVILAIKALLPIIKILATALGWLGQLLAPLKKAFEVAGVVIGFVFSGAILKALGSVKYLGPVFRALAVPIQVMIKFFGLAGKAVWNLVSRFVSIPGALRAVVGAVGNAAAKVGGAIWGGIKGVAGRVGSAVWNVGKAIISRLFGWVPSVASAARRIASTILKPITDLPKQLASAAKGLFEAFWKLGVWLIKAIVSGVKSAASEVWKAITGIIPKEVKILGVKIPLNPFRRGGMQAGGTVAALSPGEQVIYGGQSFIVPGRRRAADSVFMPLPLGAAVLTSSGQAMMAGGASLTEALALQRPHFAGGGVVGRVSTFGPPNERIGRTASGVMSDQPGVAIRPGATWQSGRATLGRIWLITITGRNTALRQIDLGPNERTGRRIDVTGAGAKQMGFDPRRFPTDAIGSATLAGGATIKGSNWEVDTAGGQTVKVPVRLGRGNRQGLIADAVEQGVQAGLAGLTRIDLQRAVRNARGATGTRLLGSVFSEMGELTREVSVPGLTQKTAEAAAAGGGGGGALVTPGGAFNPQRRSVASWIVPYLTYGASHGWRGIITSGYRPGGSSYHSGTAYPSGAVDVSEASAFARAISSKPGAKLLQWAGAKDPVHFSHPHGGKYQRGGIVGGRVGAAMQRLQVATGSEAAFTAIQLQLEALLAGFTLKRLEQIRRIWTAAASKPGTAALIRPFQAGVSLIDAAVGRLVGARFKAIEQVGAVISRREGTFERQMRRAGVDTASTAGLQATLRLEETEIIPRRRQQVADAKKAVDVAKRTGSRELVSDALSRLATAQDEWDEAVTKNAETNRALIARQAEDAREQASELVARAQFGTEMVQNVLSGLEISQRLSRIVGSPEAMRQRAQAIQAQLIPSLQGNLAALNEQLGVLQRTGGAQADIRSVLSAISTGGNEIASAFADAADLIREAAETEAAETVERAARGTTMANLGLQRMELEERIAGTFTTGGQARADYIKQTILPALESELTALSQQRVIAEQQGDPKLAEQIAQAIAEKQNNILEETLTATEQVAQNTERKLGGTLGFTYGNEGLTDLIELGTGA